MNVVVCSCLNVFHWIVNSFIPCIKLGGNMWRGEMSHCPRARPAFQRVSCGVSATRSSNVMEK